MHTHLKAVFAWEKPHCDGCRDSLLPLTQSCLSSCITTCKPCTPPQVAAGPALLTHCHTARLGKCQHTWSGSCLRVDCLHDLMMWQKREHDFSLPVLPDGGQFIACSTVWLSLTIPSLELVNRGQGSDRAMPGGQLRLFALLVINAFA